jgi:hypothetical protein
MIHPHNQEGSLWTEKIVRSPRPSQQRALSLSLPIIIARGNNIMYRTYHTSSFHTLGSRLLLPLIWASLFSLVFVSSLIPVIIIRLSYSRCTSLDCSGSRVSVGCSDFRRRPPSYYGSLGKPHPSLLPWHRAGDHHVNPIRMRL